MSLLTPAPARPGSDAELEPVRPVRPVAPRRRAGLVLAATGLATMATAGVAVSTLGHGPASREPVVSTVVPPRPLGPAPVTVSGPGDVTVVTQVYSPGQTSGWHAHAGIHAVAVLSGSLTVYDGQCRAEVFQPGRPYVGGQELHMVRNETGAPVEMVVTYLNPSTPANSTIRPPAPPCATTIAPLAAGDGSDV